MKNLIKIIVILGFIAGSILVFIRLDQSQINNLNLEKSNPVSVSPSQEKPAEEEIFPMEIESLRQREYVGGDFEIEQALPNGTNYSQSIVSYKSEGLKIYGLLTIPLAPKPENGFPAIVFVHGYIPPAQYSTTGNYPSYQATLARSQVITFKPDLRGHGNSEGEAVSAHFSEKYVIDTMYAIAYLKNHSDVNPEKLGYWGHSNGGEIGLRVVVISPDIKVAVFWAGVVGSYQDMLETYNQKIPFLRDAKDNPLVKTNGLPSKNPRFWEKIDPYFYLENISAPIQLHHGTNDSSVPIELSNRLEEELKKVGKSVEYFKYTLDDHNIGNNSGLAWKRSIEFFKNNL